MHFLQSRFFSLLQKFLVCICVAFPFFKLPLYSLSIKDKFLRGHIGDFIVWKYGKSFILVRLASLSPLSLEEISFSSLPTQKWNEWLLAKAPGHTSWSILYVDVQNNAITEAFSFTKNLWFRPQDDSSIWKNIFNAPLQKIPDQQRKKMGSPPLHKDDPDHRKIWVPSLIFQGTKNSHPSYEALQIFCPQKCSALANAHIELFFDASNPTFPFPYWVQITNPTGIAAKFFAVDSGINLFSPQKIPL